MIKISKFDAADYLNSPETVAAYFNEALESNDELFISLAIDTLARVKSKSKTTGQAGLSRESLFKSLDGKNKPEFEAVRQVLGTLGVKLVVEPIDNPKAA